MIVGIHNVKQLFDNFFKIVDFLDCDFSEIGKRFLDDVIVQKFPFGLRQFVLDKDKLFVNLSDFSDIVMAWILTLEEAIDERFQG